MAQNVGPILEMVTQRYLLRSEREWQGRQEAIQILDDVVDAIGCGDVAKIGELTTRNFEGPLQTIIPWATNRFTDALIEACRNQYGSQFWGFWMLGGMAGGGMGFIFDPRIKSQAQDWLAETMVKTKRAMQHSLPFAMDPVVYDFKINDNGTTAQLVAGGCRADARPILRTGASRTATHPHTRSFTRSPARTWNGSPPGAATKVATQRDSCSTAFCRTAPIVPNRVSLSGCARGMWI